MYIRKTLVILLCLCLLCACGEGTEESASTQSQEAAEEGSYYNAGAGLGLHLDGRGGFALSREGNVFRGTYLREGQRLLLSWEGAGTEGVFSGADLSFSAMEGTFVPVRELPSPGELGVLLHPGREYGQAESGALRLRDYSLELALDYPRDFLTPEGIIADALLVWDGVQGYVLGRNVSGSFDGSAPAEEFLLSYMESTAAADAAAVYGDAAEWRELELLEENISGRIASAEGVIEIGGAAYYSKCIMYTSTYADGTVNYICKCFFAPEDDTPAFNALANGVVNMSAVRKVGG